MPLTCGARSTVNVDRSTVDMGRVLNGLWWAQVGPVWAELGRTCGKLWRCHIVVVGHHWAMVYGLRSTVDQEALVHGPQTGLRWTESTLLLSGVVLVHRVHARVAGEGGCSPVSPAAVFLPAVSSLVSLYGGAGVQLGRGKASLGHSDHDAGV